METTQIQEMRAIERKLIIRRGIYPSEWTRLVELRKEYILSKGFKVEDFILTNATIYFNLSGKELLDLRAKGIIPARYIGFN